MFRSTCATAVLLTALGLTAVRAADDKKPDEATQAGIAAVKKKLSETKVDELLRLQPITGAPLAKVYPKQVFISGIVPSFPVARAVPEGAGVKERNLFIVKDDKVEVLSDMNALRKSLKTSTEPAKTDDALKDTAKAVLLLSQAFYQDGFFKFELSDDSFKVAKSDKGKEVTGQLVVMQGGSGTLTIRAGFDEDGKLSGIDLGSKIKPGPRPRCHATKLLDADPLIREIVTQDLLIMGRAAKPYLDEQRAKASPELKAAIDQLWQRILRENDE